MSEPLDKTCRDCIYRLPAFGRGWQCASLKSASFKKPVTDDHTCDRFKRSPHDRNGLTVFICRAESMGAR